LTTKPRPSKWALGELPEPDRPSPSVFSPRLLLATAISLVIFFPMVFPALGVGRLVLIASALGIIYVELVALADRIIALGECLCLWVPIVACVLVASGVALESEVATRLDVQRLLVLLPIFLRAGYLVGSMTDRRAYYRPIVCMGVVAAVIADFEYLTGQSLFGRTEEMRTLSRDGIFRALGASEQPLVLGVVLAATLVLVADSGLRGRLLICLVLVSGCLSTGSRGPAAIAAICAAVQFVPKAVPWVQRQGRALIALWLLLILLLALLSAFVWTRVVPGLTGGQYSTNYRFAIYSFLPEMVMEAPFGFGLGEIPTGRWLLNSELRGTVDLATTVDSELVLLTVKFGIFGFLLFICLSVLSIRALAYEYGAGAAGIVIAGSGLFVALEAWDNTLAMWMFFIGAAVSIVRRGRVHSGRLRTSTYPVIPTSSRASAHDGPLVELRWRSGWNRYRPGQASGQTF
jgi:hypothetical protein